MSSKIGIAVGIIIALIVCLVPLKTVAYTVMVDYQDTETYYEDEPYEDTETYYKTEPLEYKVVNSYVDMDRDAVIQRSPVFKKIPVPVGCVTVQNTDSVPGTFNVHFTFYALDAFHVFFFKKARGEVTKDTIVGYGEKYIGNVTLQLKAGQEGTAKCNPFGFGSLFTRYLGLDVDEPEWFWEYYEVTPSKKTIEEQRTITKYRQVEKQRTVTKQHPETRYKKVTMPDYLVHYQ